MGEKDFRISAVELHRIEVECQECRSAIVFEATAGSGPGESLCPNCGELMRGLKTLVSAYRDFFKHLQSHEESVHFLVRLDD